MFTFNKVDSKQLPINLLVVAALVRSNLSFAVATYWQLPLVCAIMVDFVIFFYRLCPHNSGVLPLGSWHGSVCLCHAGCHVYSCASIA